MTQAFKQMRTGREAEEVKSREDDYCCTESRTHEYNGLRGESRYDKSNERK